VPIGFDFLAVKGLRKESAAKLQQFRPFNLGQAGRISGVSPADVGILIVAVEAFRRQGGGGTAEE
jgi:tRNA uridine 5-carboxymethylaminomethyl modification enzyme